MKLDPKSIARLNRIIERACEPHKSAKRCGRWGSADGHGFQGMCMRPAGHGGACDPGALLGDDQADIRFLCGVVRDLGASDA